MDRDRLRFLRGLNLIYQGLDGRTWRIRPTTAPDTSAWPFTPPVFREGVDCSWVVPAWTGTDIPTTDSYYLLRGIPGMTDAIREGVPDVVLPARLCSKDGSVQIPAYLLPGHQGALVHGLIKRFELDVVFEWTPQAWVIDSETLWLHHMGWKRSRCTKA